MKILALKGIRGQLLIPIIGIIFLILLATTVFNAIQNIENGKKSINNYKEVIS